MGWKTSRNALIPHNRPLSRAEMEAFNALHMFVQNVVLLPVVINGEQRFALALVKKNGEELTSMIIGYLAVPEDRLTTVSGGDVPPMRSDEPRVSNKNLH